MRSRLLQSRWAVAAVVLFGLLMAVIGGALGAAGDPEAEAATTVTDRIVIPPAGFIPNDDFDYYNTGGWLQTVGNGASWRCFTAPVQFPVDMPIKKVNVNRVFMWAHDNDPAQVAQLALFRPVPKNGSDYLIGFVNSSDSAADPQEYSFRGYGQPVFLWNNAPYLSLCLHENTKFYGAAINYTYDL